MRTLTTFDPGPGLGRRVGLRAALHRTARDLKDLDALMAKLAAAWHDPAEGSYCNWQLHRRIAEITPNAVLRAFVERNQ